MAEPTAAIPCCRECFFPLVIPYDAPEWMMCGRCKLPYAHIRECLVLLIAKPGYPGFDR
jgi:hypothetical protein